jgi:acyl-CoA thioester hydrolase
MANVRHVTLLRVRYSETDQMGSYYNSRVLEWFECGRSELLRSIGRPYRDLEREGLLLPVSEAHIEYRGKARYDDPLRVSCVLSMAGRARIRFDVEIEHAESGDPVCRGYTVHAATNLNGKPIRPPRWLIEALEDRRE